MSYCTLADVQGLIPLVTLSAASKPTATQVTEYIEKCDDEINSALSSRGLAIPVTSPADFVGELETLCATGAAARTLQAMFPAAQGPGSNSQGQILWDYYTKRLSEIRRNIGIPSGATTSGSSSSRAPTNFIVGQGAFGADDDELEDSWGQDIKTSTRFGRGRVF